MSATTISKQKTSIKKTATAGSSASRVGTTRTAGSSKPTSSASATLSKLELRKVRKLEQGRQYYYRNRKAILERHKKRQSDPEIAAARRQYFRDYYAKNLKILHERRKKRRDELSDGYVRYRSVVRYGENLPELYPLIRAELTLTREIRKKQKETKKPKGTK